MIIRLERVKEWPGSSHNFNEAIRFMDIAFLPGGIVGRGQWYDGGGNTLSMEGNTVTFSTPQSVYNFVEGCHGVWKIVNDKDLEMDEGL